jgi:EmrB/QacA subfamily drug resistance transporter
MQRKWWTLIVVCVATFMLLLDITIVNVALPKIAHGLHATFSDIQWVVDAYALTLAALLLTTGSLGDLVGRKLVFTIGLLLFSAASLLCALSTSALFLILARGAQGIGGAIMFSTSLALLAQEFHGRERGTAFGIWGATLGAAVAIGPLLGGLLTDSLGWQSIFYINVPIGIVAAMVTIARVPESRDPEGKRIDWTGTFTFTAALFMLVLALILGDSDGWGSARIVALLGGAVVLMILFVLSQVLQENAMFDLSLFRKPAFDGAAIAAFSISASMFAMFLYLTLYLQTILDLSPLQTGLRFLPTTLMMFVVAAVAGSLSARVPVRLLLGLGLTLVGVGLLLMRGLNASSHWTHLLAGFLVAGAGVGLVNPSLASTAIGVVPPQRSGMASGINSTFRQVGIATGIAALGAIFQHDLGNRLAPKLAGTPAGAHAASVVHAVAAGGAQQVLASVPTALRPGAALAVHGAFAGSLDEILLVGAIVALVGAALTSVLVRGRDFVSYPAPEPLQASAESGTGRPRVGAARPIEQP